MASLNLTAVVPAIVTNLTVSSVFKSASLKWDASSGLSDVYNVARNTSDTPVGATTIATTETNAYVDNSGTAGTTYYYFVRTVNQFGKAGPWSSSVTFNASAVTTNDVTSTGNPPLQTVTSNLEASAGSITSNYGVWSTSFGSLGFTGNNNGYSSAYILLVVSISDILNSGGGSPVIRLDARFRLRDLTLNQDVPAATQYQNVFFQYGAGPAKVNIGKAELNINYTSGFLGTLVPGHEYAIYCEFKKDRSGSGTFTAEVNMSTGESTSASYS